jgi:hypothetical protein
MTADEFVRNFRTEKERLLQSYLTGTPATAVSALIQSMELSVEQREILEQALDQVLTDAFHAVVLGLNSYVEDEPPRQQPAADEIDSPVSGAGGPIETMAFRYFQSDGRTGPRPTETRSAPVAPDDTARRDEPEEEALDFSDVNSRELAEQLVAEGLLFKILLFPAELGGKDVTQNTAFVPAGIPEIKDKLTETLIKYVRDGVIDKLAVEPVYKGSSFIPSRIVMKASHSEKKGEFLPTIDIW